MRRLFGFVIAVIITAMVISWPFDGIGTAVAQEEDDDDCYMREDPCPEWWQCLL